MADKSWAAMALREQIATVPVRAVVPPRVDAAPGYPADAAGLLAK